MNISRVIKDIDLRIWDKETHCLFKTDDNYIHVNTDFVIQQLTTLGLLRKGYFRT